MKTEQEQIKEIMETLLAHEPIIDVPYETINDIAVALVQEGYGNISEYKAEIEQLKAKNKSQERENGFLKYCQCLTHGVDGSSHIKKAQIDVLNKAKERLDSAPNGWAYTTYIDELIKEVQNGKDKS